MVRGKKYFNKDVVYVSLMKHSCPDCYSKLKTVKVSKIVNYYSPEVKDFDFYFGAGKGITINGDVEFIWKEFECPNCQKHFTVEELKEIEKIEPKGHTSDEQNTKKRNKTKDLIIFIVLSMIFITIIYFFQK